MLEQHHQFLGKCTFKNASNCIVSESISKACTENREEDVLLVSNRFFLFKLDDQIYLFSYIGSGNCFVLLSLLKCVVLGSGERNSLEVEVV